MKKILFVLFVAAILIAGIAFTTSKTNAAHPVDGHCPRPNCSAITSTDRNVAAVLYHNETCLLPDASGFSEFEALWPVSNCSQCVRTGSNSGAEFCVFKATYLKTLNCPTKQSASPFKTPRP
jgi:hypothetical protein